MTEQDKIVNIEGQDYSAAEFAMSEEHMAALMAAQENLDEVRINRYECEACGVVDELTEEQAYTAGWDYPPFIGLWGVVSPRTCPNCLIDKTAYWAVLTRAELTEKHQATIRRILGEKIVVTE
jgi:hypothetical protein